MKAARAKGTRRLWLLAAGAATLGSVVVPGNALADPSDTLTGEQQIRQAFGLDSSAAQVALADATPGANRSWIGIPITSSEVDEMNRRNTAGLSLAAVTQAIDANWPGISGGAWIDQEAGGNAIIAVTSSPAGLSDTISRLLPAGTSFAIRTVTHSTAELTSLQNQIEADTANMIDQGIPIVGSATYPTDDIVRIRLQAGTSPEVAQSVRSRYPSPAVEVVVSAFPVGFNADRYAGTGIVYGGSQIIQTASTTATVGNYCTASPTAKGGTTGKYFGITAGHCGNGGYFYLGRGFGNGKGDYLGPGYTGDNGFFRSTTSSPTSCDCTDFGPITNRQSNQIIAGGGALVSMTRYASKASSYYIGRPVCQSGATSNNYICDKIRSVTATTAGTEGGHTGKVINEIEVYCPSQGGDSGSPHVSSTVWLGILSSGGGSGACGNGATSATDFSRTQFLASVTNDTPALASE